MLLLFSMDNFEGVLCYPAVVSTVESDPTSLNSNTSSHLHIFLFSAGWKLWRYFEMVFSLFMIFVSCLLHEGQIETWSGPHPWKVCWLDHGLPMFPSCLLFSLSNSFAFLLLVNNYWIVEMLSRICAHARRELTTQSVCPSATEIYSLVNYWVFEFVWMGHKTLRPMIINLHVSAAYGKAHKDQAKNEPKITNSHGTVEGAHIATLRLWPCGFKSCRQ